MNVTARSAIDIGNTTEETVNVNETNAVPVEETEPAENTEKKVNLTGSVDIFITTWAEEADDDEASTLEYSSSDIEPCTVEKDAVVSKGEAVKDFKIATNTGMKKYLRCEKCGNYL